MRRTLKSTLIFVLVAILAFVSGEEATLQQYKRLKDILLNFYGGMNGIYRHVQSGKDLSFFQRAEERLPGYLRDISAAWDAGITLYGHVAELGKCQGWDVLFLKRKFFPFRSSPFRSLALQFRVPSNVPLA